MPRRRPARVPTREIGICALLAGVLAGSGWLLLRGDDVTSEERPSPRAPGSARDTVPGGLAAAAREPVSSSLPAAPHLARAEAIDLAVRVTSGDGALADALVRPSD